MRAYLIRRLLALIPTLFFASVIVFSTVRMIPGDIIDLMISQNDISAGKTDREQLERTLGLDQPMYIQYFRWVGNILFRGDFGSSLWQEQSVIAEIGEGAKIGACSIVLRDVEPYTTVVGNPAKAVGKRNTVMAALTMDQMLDEDCTG